MSWLFRLASLGGTTPSTGSGQADAVVSYAVLGHYR
jgi:hypothetical protein